MNQTQHDRIAATTRVIHTMQTRKMDFYHASCPVCGTGQITARVWRRDDAGRVLGSEGSCSTADCLNWRD